MLSAQTMADADVTAKNTLEEPDRVGLTANPTAAAAGGVMAVTLPPVSWTAIELG